MSTMCAGEDNTGQKGPWHAISAICIIAATAAALVGLMLVGVSENYAANRDFIEYWAAGHQLAHHANPYDPAGILRIQRAAGMLENDPQITFSPPVALCLLLPLGLVGPKAGFILWSLALIGSLLVSIWLIWMVNGKPDNPYHLCGYLFAPAIACLILGQIGTFLLLGIVLFLYLHDRLAYLAGAVLLPCVWKPHLFLPFFIALFCWSVFRKEHRILAGFGMAVAACTALTWRLDPYVWAQYAQMATSTSNALHGYVPTLSATLRFLIAPHAVWLQYVPEVAACCWVVWYFWTRRERWSWMDQGSWVLLVSAACAPYGWFTDEAILLPAVLSGVYRAIQLRRSLVPIAIIGLVALIEVCALGHIASTHYLWTVPAWLGWYVYATWGRNRQRTPIGDAEMVSSVTTSSTNG